MALYPGSEYHEEIRSVLRLSSMRLISLANIHIMTGIIIPSVPDLTARLESTNLTVAIH